MEVAVETLKKRNNGWELSITVDLSKLNLNTINLDYDSLNNIEDWQVTFKDNKLYFKGFMEISEPWEDEPIEELVKAAQLEVKWRADKLLL
ncbi:MAG TPA: hypothetical protein VK444_05790 [Methanobacteriaceae archaeon]|nr:hypothetical protein [Methanobacteriaceae archaeon]